MVCEFLGGGQWGPRLGMGRAEAYPGVLFALEGRAGGEGRGAAAGVEVGAEHAG